MTYVFLFFLTARLGRDQPSSSLDNAQEKKTKGPGEQKEGHGHLHGASAGCYQAVESAQAACRHVAGFK